MFSLTVRDSMMVAHSLKDPSFGPAQRLHGATFIVDLQFIAETLDSQNVVIDIQVARDILGQAIAPLAFQNLDDLEEFHGHLTTAEYLAAHICARTRELIPDTFHGKLRVRLGESHDAWATYEED